MTDHSPPFDEKAALAELDRLRDEIGVARQARQKKSEEFDRFIQGFQTPPPPDVERAIERPETAAVAAQPPPAPSPDTEHWLHVRERLNTPRAVPIVRSPGDPRIAATSRRRAQGALLTMGAAAVVVIALAVPGYRARRPPADPSPAAPVARADTASRAPLASPAPKVTPAPSTAPLPTALPSAAPSTPAAGTLRLELRAVAPVWLRVVVDDQKKLEGMIAAGQRLSFSAERSIVVRAGNGADVLVKTADREDPFGVAGQALTRTFVVPGGSVSPAR